MPSASSREPSGKKAEAPPGGTSPEVQPAEQSSLNPVAQKLAMRALGASGLPSGTGEPGPGGRDGYFRAPGQGPPVQARRVTARASSRREDPEAIREAAALGTRGPAVPLPFLDTIQRSFGRHDVSAVRAHLGSAAEEGAAAMGAQAFAAGRDVAFAGSPTLRTAAHEAAHVVQQRGGVQLLGGVGEEDDEHERHADAVADRVAEGRSSEALLDAYVSREPPRDDEEEGTPAVQRRALPRQVQRAPGDPPEEKKVAFRIVFDKPLTRAEFIDLTERTIYGRRTNMVWSGVADSYTAAQSPVWAYVPGSTLQGRLKDYGESAARVVKGIDDVKDAATYQRLNKILQKLTPAQWADFEKRVTGKTTSLDEFEAAVDAYLAARKSREAERGERERVIMKLYGLKALYEKYREWKAWLAMGVVDAAMHKELEDALHANDFPGGIPEFEKFIQDYVTAFRTETVRIGQDLLEQYDGSLYREAQRYQDAGVVAAMHQKLAPMRAEYAGFEKNAQVYNDYVRDEPRSRLPGSGGILKSTRDEAMTAGEQAKKHLAAAQQSTAALSGEFPILKEDHLPLDRRLDKAAMAKADPSQLQALLLAHIQARRDDVEKTRETLATDPEKAFSLDNLLKLSLERQGVDPKDIFGLIVQDKVSSIKTRDAIIGVMVGVFAVALTIVSFGTGALAVAAAVGAFTLSAVTAYQEFKDYETKNAAYGAGLLSDDPSLVWVIVAVVGAAIDLGQAVRAVKAIAPLAKGVQGSADVAKFREGLKALEQAGTIDARIVESAEKAAAAHGKALDASKDLARALGGKVYSFPGPLADPDVFKEVVRLAYYKIREAGFVFEKFALEVKQARQAANLAELTTEELGKLKKAYEQGRAFASEDELLKYMKQTHPMSAVDPAAAPAGRRTPIGAAEKDPENIRALGRENDSADILAQRGYRVEQNPNVAGTSNPLSNPDYLVEGKVFDNYAPSAKKSVRGIWSYVQEEKVAKGQTTRVVLNLQDWAGDLAALKKQFQDWPMAGLDEVIVILKDKTVLHLVP